MTINPGGVLPPDQVVGRDDLIGRYWEILRLRSLALVAPRRSGKSSILTRMQARPAEGFHFVLQNLEGRPDLGELASLLYAESSELLARTTKVRSAANAVIERIGGKIDTPWFKLALSPDTWNRVLGAIFDDLQAYAAEHDLIVVVAWDEFTWYLHDLAARGRGHEAGLLLDRLRAIRQARDHDRVRMCFTGSIGLEEVLDRLQEGQHVREPMNDVDRQVVPVLDPGAAAELAGRLVRAGTGNARPAVAASLAEAGEGHPYFIQHLAQAMKYAGSWSVEAVAEQLTALIASDQDPLELAAFVERIAVYRRTQRGAIEGVLDHLSERACTVDELVEATSLPRGELVDVLRFLRRDLYLRQDGRKYRFQLDILRRFWRRDRGLE